MIETIKSVDNFEISLEQDSTVLLPLKKIMLQIMRMLCEIRISYAIIKTCFIDIWRVQNLKNKKWP